MFDVLPMDACHILLGRPWKYDSGVMHDERRNTYQFEKDGKKFILRPLDKQVEKEEIVMILSYVKDMEE